MHEGVVIYDLPCVIMFLSHPLMPLSPETVFLQDVLVFVAPLLLHLLLLVMIPPAMTTTLQHYHNVLF